MHVFHIVFLVDMIIPYPLHWTGANIFLGWNHYDILVFLPLDVCCEQCWNSIYFYAKVKEIIGSIKVLHNANPHLPWFRWRLSVNKAYSSLVHSRQQIRLYWNCLSCYIPMSFIGDKGKECTWTVCQKRLLSSLRYVPRSAEVCVATHGGGSSLTR